MRRTHGAHLRVRTPRKGRGAEFVEFAILFPAFLAMVIFLIGASQLIITQIGLQDSMQQFVREGAQVGGLAGCSTNGCSGTSQNGVPSPYGNLISSINSMPGGNSSYITGLSISSGAGALSCSLANPYVTATIKYKASTLLPLMNIMGNIVTGNNWTLSATASARCDVAN